MTGSHHWNSQHCTRDQLGHRHQLRRRSQVVLLLASAACSGFRAPTPEILARVARLPPPAAPWLREAGVVRIESGWLSGTFEARGAARTGRQPACRLQLFPDIGGKVLDVSAASDRIRGLLPQPQVHYAWDVAQVESPPLHLLACIAITLLEHCAPVSPERVLAARVSDSGVELTLRPVVAGSEVVARLDGQGRLVARRYRLGPAGWREEIADDDRFIVSAPGLRLEATIQGSEAVPSLPDVVFELVLAGDGQR
jgi:hypothetical protein